MGPFTKIFTATEDYFVTVPIRQILRKIYRVKSCSGNSTRYIFGSINFKIRINVSFRS